MTWTLLGVSRHSEAKNKQKTIDKWYLKMMFRYIAEKRGRTV